MFHLYLAFLLVGICLVPAAYAGISTNGGAFTEDQNNVWNLGDRPVPYCVEVHPDFPLSNQEVESVIRESIDNWRAFFVKYGLDKLKFSSLTGNDARGLSLNFQRTDECSTNETIQFKIGVMGKLVDRALDSGGHAGLGLAIRQTFDHATYRNGGIVWIRNWPFDRASFKHMVLHELGHIFGMEHDSVHVMDAKVADRILDCVATPELLGRIETPTWPYKFINNETIDFTFIGRKAEKSEPNYLLTALTNEFGFNTDHSHKLSLLPRRLSPPFYGWKLTLEIQELQTLRTIRLQGLFRASLPRYNSWDGMRGPVLYTTYYCPHCGPNGARKLRHLDPESGDMEAPGVFIREDQPSNVYPAVIDIKKGLSLQVFIPSESDWWSTIHYLGTYYLNP